MTACCENVTQMRQLEAAARAASESQAEATAVQEAMSSEAKRAQASIRPAFASVWNGSAQLRSVQRQALQHTEGAEPIRAARRQRH